MLRNPIAVQGAGQQHIMHGRMQQQNLNNSNHFGGVDGQLNFPVIQGQKNDANGNLNVGQNGANGAGGPSKTPNPQVGQLFDVSAKLIFRNIQGSQQAMNSA